jgi:hypothetical protein
MQQAVTAIRVTTRGKGLFEITSEVESWLGRQGVITGLRRCFLKKAQPYADRRRGGSAAILVSCGFRKNASTFSGKDRWPA